MMKLLIFAAFVGFAAADKIVGGQQANAGEFPYIVHLDSNTIEAFCDGSIINPTWILSAAHCEQRGDPTKNRAVAGDQNLANDDGSEQTRTIAKFIPHEEYNSRTMANDIMLIKLTAAFELNNLVSAIQYPSMRPAAGTACDVSGWGNTLSSATHYPDELQWVTVPVVSTADCNRRVSYDGEILEMMICIGEMDGGKDSCQGDSGGPVVLSGSNTQVGIVSWGYGCAEVNKPGVYTDVYYFVANNWITDTMAAN